MVAAVATLGPTNAANSPTIPLIDLGSVMSPLSHATRSLIYVSIFQIVSSQYVLTSVSTVISLLR